MSSFGERLKARRRMQEQSYRNMKRVRQKNMRVMNALDTEVRVLDTEIKRIDHVIQKEKELLEDNLQSYKRERKIVQHNMLLIPAEDEDLEMIRSTEDIRLLKLHLLRLIKDTDNGDSNIKKFKKLPRGAFLPKLSIDPQIPLKMIERDMKDLRRFNHIELRDSLLVRTVSVGPYRPPAAPPDTTVGPPAFSRSYSYDQFNSGTRGTARDSQSRGLFAPLVDKSSAFPPRYKPVVIRRN